MAFRTDHQKRILALSFSLCVIGGVIPDIDHIFTRSRDWHPAFFVIGIILVIIGVGLLFAHDTRLFRMGVLKKPDKK